MCGDLPARWVEVGPWAPLNEMLVMFCCCLVGQPVAQALAGASRSPGLLVEGGMWGYRPVGRAARAPRDCLMSCVLRDPPVVGWEGGPSLSEAWGWALCPTWNWVWDPKLSFGHFAPLPGFRELFLPLGEKPGSVAPGVSSTRL